VIAGSSSLEPTGTRSIPIAAALFAIIAHYRFVEDTRRPFRLQHKS
jgi:hypothetical protein